MSDVVKSDLKIPDLFYDVYARLLPGVISVVVFKFLVLGGISAVHGIHITVTLLIGFIIGLITNPVSSRITRYIEGYYRKKAGKPMNYELIVQIKYSYTSRFALILSKMHGEIVFFVQTSLHLCIIAVIVLCRSSIKYNISYAIFLFVFAYLCFIFSFEIADRRLKRTISYEQVFSTYGKNHLSRSRHSKLSLKR